MDKRLSRRAFEQAAAHYDEVALLQREVGARLLDRLDLIRLAPKIILDVGAGTGVATHTLVKRYPDARIIALDFAIAMLRQARQRVPLFNKWLNKRQDFICGDAEQLPLATASVDMIFSNLTLQWCADLDHTFAEFRRVLKPGGLLMFSTLGPDTLKELRASWAQVDDYDHVHIFIDMHDIGDALVRARLTNPVMDVENFTLTYPDTMKLMRDLKTLGAHNVSDHRPPGLTGKAHLKTLIAAYETHRRDKLLPATYEVVYGHAWAPEMSAAETLPQQESGVIKIPLSQLRRTQKNS